MPTNTDLVTDLPADFAVFGQGVDTTMADLKGGTTGQILSKATNTDMDFTWIANDQGDITGITATSPLTGGGTSGAVTVGIQSASTSQSGAVQLSDSTSTTSSVLASTPTATKAAYDLAAAAVAKSTVTAKGSIFTATASATPAQIAVGSNGESLVVDSSTSTGLRYQGSIAAGRNYFINGGQDIWQRGISVAVTTGTTVFTSDRWQIQSNGASNAMTVSRQSTNDSTNLPSIQYCSRVQRNAGQTGTTVSYLAQSIESTNSIQFAGKAVTMSFYARAGALYSPASATLSANLYSGTGIDQSILGTYTGAASVIAQGVTLTTTWQRFTMTATVGATATELAMYFNWSSVGTAGATDYFEVTGVQLEVGSVATQFSRAGGNIQGELAACKRYYQKSYNLDTAPAASTTLGGVGLYWAATTSAVRAYGKFEVEMRTTPTIAMYDGGGGAAGTCYKGGYGKTAATYNLGSTGFTGGTTDATSASEFFFQYTASAEL